MNLIDTLRLNRPLKRRSWYDYLTVQHCNCHEVQFRPHSECPKPALMFPNYVDPKLTVEDILAEDWHVQEEPIGKEKSDYHYCGAV